MEGRITEERVTKCLLNWLETNSWEIVCYDFPQSGTGVCIHPNEALRTTKNKDSFIPDIVAHRKGIVVFFENKDRFVLDDFNKVTGLKNSTSYIDSILELLRGINCKRIFYGVGMPHTENNAIKSNEQMDKVDFIVFSHPDKAVGVFHDPHSIFP